MKIDQTSDRPQRPQVQLFTDGACLGNPGPGGWAYICRNPATGEEREASGGERNTTNNRMELTAVIRAIESLGDGGCRIELIGDSEYVLKGLTQWMPGWIKRGWRKADKKPVLNADLWQQLNELQAAHDLKITWVRGHTGHVENERCDELAKAEATKRL